jgi:DNA-binding PadR family transcriptional regulator
MTDKAAARDSALSSLAFQVLLALGAGPLHGYAIIRDIEDRTGGRTSVRSGTLYTMIQRLLEDGLVEDAPAPAPGSDSRRKYYRITALGRMAASTEAERLRELLSVARARNLAPERP